MAVANLARDWATWQKAPISGEISYSHSETFGVVQKPLNHRGKPGGGRASANPPLQAAPPISGEISYD